MVTDALRPAPAGRVVLALAFSAAFHAVLLSTGQGRPDGGLLPAGAIHAPLMLQEPLQWMAQTLQAPGSAAAPPSDPPQSQEAPLESAAPAAAPDALSGLGGLLPLNAPARYYLPYELDVRPQIRTRVEPAYPRGAAVEGITAAFTARVFIDEEGRVERVLAPDKSVADPFAASVIAAFRAARYTPGIKDGKPVKSLLLIEVNFEAFETADTFRRERY